MPLIFLFYLSRCLPLLMMQLQTLMIGALLPLLFDPVFDRMLRA